MTAPPEPTAAIEAAAQLLRGARHAVVLTGAGLSAESGVPTYRGPDGIWTKFAEPTIDGWDLFQSDPAAWWRDALEAEARGSDFLRALRLAEPNPGHHALAALEQLGHIGHIITQNIDGLHAAAGSRSLTEIHGNRRLVRCMQCALRQPSDRIPLAELPPRCDACGGVLKSDVVMFGEPIPSAALAASEQHTHRADLFLVVGTSAVVYPAAAFPILAARRGVPVIEINPSETDLTAIASIAIRLPAGTALPRLVERVAAVLGDDG